MWERRYPDAQGPISYFSAEFALHQSLPSTSGRSVCSPETTARRRATRNPAHGVGSCTAGIFHQSVSPEGCSRSYERLTWAQAPGEPALTPDGKPCVLRSPGIAAFSSTVWRVRLGRVKLSLLDTDLEETRRGTGNCPRLLRRRS